MGTKNTDRLRSGAKNGVLVLVSTFTGLVLAELVLRIFFPIAYSMEVEYEPDGHVGLRLKANKVYTLRSKGTCTVNNLGFRGATDLTYDKPPGTLRIVALGGSSTFSYQTDDSKIWTFLLEQKLSDAYGINVEVINAGVPGFSIFESKINYLYRIRPLKPDIVLVYHTWNDMKIFHLLENGEPLTKAVYREDRVKSFLRNFQIAWRVRNYINDVIYARQRENTYGTSNDVPTRITPGGAAHQWEKQNYDDLALLLKKDNVLPVFTSQAGLLSADNLEDPAVRAVVYTEFQRLPFSETLHQWNEISKIIETSARENDAVFIDVYNAVPHQTEYFSDHVHLTERGNARVADVLFTELTKAARVDRLIRKDYALPDTASTR